MGSWFYRGHFVTIRYGNQFLNMGIFSETGLHFGMDHFTAGRGGVQID